MGSATAIAEEPAATTAGGSTSATRIQHTPVKNVVAPLPRPALSGIALEIMIGCNLKCTLCNVDKLKPQHLSAARIDEILGKIPTLQRFVVIGHGEPLLHPEWLDIMALGRKYQLQLHIVTNGMLMQEKHVDAFPPHAYVQFSIDSLKPEVYASMRPGGNLIRVLRSVQLLAERRPDVRIGIQTLITRKTFDHIDETAAFAQQFGFDFNALYPGTVSPEMYREHYPATQHPRKIITSPRPCQEPFGSLMVGINGDIYPCCYMYGSRNKENPDDNYIHEMVDGRFNTVSASQYKLGNIYHDNIYDVWNNSRICSIRNTLYNSLEKTREYDQLRESLNTDSGYDYCKMCALRWGKIC